MQLDQDGSAKSSFGLSDGGPESAFDTVRLLHALDALEKGDFSVRLPLEWIGVAGKVADTFNRVVSLNQRMVEFLDSVTLQKLVDEQLAKGVVVENAPMIKRAISSAPVVKPIRVNAPNSVFALGNSFAKS